MNTREIEQLHKDYVMPTYAPGLALVRGEGRKVWDADGREFLDFLSGIAVISIGHAHPRMVQAISEQAGRLMHVSNLYYNELQPQLGKAISDRSLGGKCFFCNSGAEANEGLIKLARLWGSDRGRYEIITMENSFHGRTLATLTATGQEKVKKGFEPLPTGFVHVPFNDLEAVRTAVNEHTAAVLVEAVQGEGGVVPAGPSYLQGLRALCDELGILLLCDEVQCGIGRTGTWFAYQHSGIRPDAVALAKGLGGGFPIGAITATPEMSDVFQPGHHATTFGGTPLACAAALAVIETIEEEGLLEHATAMGARLQAGLRPLAETYDWVAGVRGVGLMVGLALEGSALPLQQAVVEKGLLALATANTVLRFLPPLNVTEAEIDQAVGIVHEACATVAQAT